MIRLTGPLTRRRREAIAEAARQQINAATFRMQRNVYRAHALRLTEAVSDLNEAIARAAHTDAASVQEAASKAVALARMVRDYDALQSTTDTTIQEN